MKVQNGFGFKVVIPHIHEWHYEVTAANENQAIEIAMRQFHADPRKDKECACDDEMVEEPIVFTTCLCDSCKGENENE